MLAHDKHHHESYQLADYSGYSCALDSHVETENKEGIEHTIHYGSRDNSIHGIARIALETHLIVHAEGAHNERSAEQRDAEILARIGQNGRCAA